MNVGGISRVSRGRGGVWGLLHGSKGVVMVIFGGCAYLLIHICYVIVVMLG